MSGFAMATHSRGLFGFALDGLAGAQHFRQPAFSGEALLSGLGHSLFFHSGKVVGALHRNPFADGLDDALLGNPPKATRGGRWPLGGPVRPPPPRPPLPTPPPRPPPAPSPR